MDFICDVIAVGFYFTVGAMLCVVCVALLFTGVIKWITDRDYKRGMKERKEKKDDKC